MWKKAFSHEWVIWVFLSLVLLIPTLPLFHPGLPITHDGKDHVARIANFYTSMSEGNLIPRWAGNLNWGYGHPILMFLYPLPSYIASLVHFFGLSFIDSTKAVFGISYIVSGLTMYMWLKCFLRRDAALFGALLYTFAPYRFIDFYVRGAIGEHVAFAFVPLVCYFLYQLSVKVNRWNVVGGAVSLALLILAHNAVSLMALPLILLYVVLLVHTSKHKKVLVASSLAVIVTGFMLASFFWLPATIEGKYTLRSIVLQDQYLNRFSPLVSIFYSPWNYGESGQFSVQIGIVHWVMLLGTIFLFIRKRENKWVKWYLGFLLCAVFLSLFLMIGSSLFLWKLIPLIQQFQFPWRFLFVPVFAIAILGGYLMNMISPRSVIGITCLSVLFWLGVQYPYWQAKGYYTFPDSYYSRVYPGTTDTGESAPIWSVRFMEQYPDYPVNVIGGKAIVDPITESRTSTWHAYHVSAETDAQLRENTVYFPGWMVFVDGKPQSIEYQDPHNRGVMTFMVPKGEHTVHIVFKDTKLRLLANNLSLLGLVILGILSILNKRVWERFQ